MKPLGDRALLVTLGSGIDEGTHKLVQAFSARVAGAALDGVTDIVPAYASVAVHYDPVRISYDAMAGHLGHLMERLDEVELPEPRTVEIPVRYGGADGPDLQALAELKGLSTARVIEMHSGGDYLVHLIGFAPGFPYLGGLDPRLATPRRETPRVRVPAGSVGIGGSQTGVYPFDSPGGWHLIGRTPLVLFDAARESPSLLRVGDRVRFRPVT